MKRSNITGCILSLILFALPVPALAQSQPYKLAVPPYTFQFPGDHASHPDYRTEWWYYTGHLSSEGRTFGYQLTFFQVGVNPARRMGGSQWALHTLFFAHFTITDERGDTFYYTENIGRPALNMAGSLEDRYRVWIGKWAAELLEDGNTHRLQARSGQNAIALDLSPVKPPVIHGFDGVSRKADGEGRASHYYSLTRMETTGTLTLDGQEYKVNGLSWMDHEFGTNQLTPQQAGWDWFSLQLDNDRELMLYVMRLKDGALEPASSGTVVYADGTWKHLELAAYSIEKTGIWESSKTGGVYPSGWIIRVPGEDMELRITPAVKDQELAIGSIIGVTYWEGSVRVEGRDRGSPVTGVGYVELTGYAGRVPGF